MVDEIVTSWDNPNELVLELAGAGPLKVKERVQEWFDDSATGSMTLALVDASGGRVEFPVKLVSATKIDAR